MEVIREVPKAELHLHLEDFIVEQEEKFESLQEFIEYFRSAQKSRREVSDFERVFRRLARYMVRNGIVYAEVFFSPGNFVLNHGMSYKELIKFFEKQIKQIKIKDGLLINIIIDVSRSHGIKYAQSVLDLVIKHPCKVVIGIGLGGNEKIGPAKDFAKLFEIARKAGLKTVAHAGESNTYQSVIDTVELLKVSRIGHGISAAYDDSTMKLLEEKNIPLEIQLTSNIVTGHFVKKIEHHPARILWDHGVSITVNTDDPNLFKTSLIYEYWLMHNKLLFSMTDLYCIIINGFRASFLSEGKKQRFIRLVNKKWNRRFLITERMKRESWRDACKKVFNKVE